MPSRFKSGVYDPELVKLMSDALEAAWSKYDPPPRNADLARQIMATAIIESVDAEERSSRALVAAAVRGLDAALESRLLKTALGEASKGAESARGRQARLQQS
jgi:hypothetical protein